MFEQVAHAEIRLARLFNKQHTTHPPRRAPVLQPPAPPDCPAAPSGLTGQPRTARQYKPPRHHPPVMM